MVTPVGDNLLEKSVYCSCDVYIEGKVLLTNLVVIDVVDFDVILGLDWLSFHLATLKCYNKVVEFETHEEATFSFQGECNWVLIDF